MLNFKIASGKVAGTKHLLVGERNQDSTIFCQTEDFICGVVSDGMSIKGTSTEVGSILATTLITSLMATNRELLKTQPIEDFLICLKHNLLRSIWGCIKSMCDNPNAAQMIVQHFFKFTLVCFVMNEEETTIFSFGDGFYKLNDKEHLVNLQGTEEPMYIAGASEIDTPAFNFKIKEVISTKDVKELMISTDGIEYLLKTGKTCQDFFNDIYFENTDNLSKELYEIQRYGHALHDDVGMIIVKSAD